MLRNIKYLVSFIIAFSVIGVGYAQRSDRDFVRKGNSFYADSMFVKAEVEYRRALDVNPHSIEANYNLGNAMMMQQKAQEAMKQYVNAASLVNANEKGIALTSEGKKSLAKIYHNMGVIMQSSKQYDECIEAYKKALRNNPADHETRYNLSLAMRQKQQQEQQQQEQQDEQQQDEQQQDEQQEKQQEEQQQEQEKKEQQQVQQSENEMSKENAEQMLKAIMQDEKDIQDKVKKAMQEVQPRRFDKDW